METMVNNLWRNYTNPLVSIIVPVYNRRHTLPRTIQSIKSQTFKEGLSSKVCKFFFTPLSAA